MVRSDCCYLAQILVLRATRLLRVLFAMAWVMPGGSKATAAPAGGSGHGRKGVGKGAPPGATPKSKAQPKAQAKSAAARATAQPPRRLRQQEGAGILATLGAVAKVLPLLETLGFGAGGGEHGRQPRRTDRRAGKPAAAKGKGDGSWARSGRVAKIPPKDILDHLGKPALVVNLAGTEVPMVAISGHCHWGYWSPHWSTCANCGQKRDPAAKPEPTIFKH